MNEQSKNAGLAPSGCLRPSRFWEVALAQGPFTAAESEHLLHCSRCRRTLTSTLTSVKQQRLNESLLEQEASIPVVIAAEQELPAHRSVVGSEELSGSGRRLTHDRPEQSPGTTPPTVAGFPFQSGQTFLGVPPEPPPAPAAEQPLPSQSQPEGKGLIYTRNPGRGRMNREVLQGLVLGGHLAEIEILTDLKDWKHPFPPAFVNIACTSSGDLMAVGREAHEMCQRVADHWPQVRPHVGLEEDLPWLTLQLLSTGAYDVFLDISPRWLLQKRYPAEQVPTTYYPEERNRFRSSVVRYLRGAQSPHDCRLTGEHIPRQEAEWYLLYDRWTPPEERLTALAEMIEHYRGHPQGIRQVNTTAFGMNLELFAELMERAALVLYLIEPGSQPALFSRNQLVPLLEKLDQRPRSHEFHDRSVPVLYITANDSDDPYLPLERRFSCSSNAGLLCLLWHALTP